jgi:hypothetical protein
VALPSGAGDGANLDFIANHRSLDRAAETGRSLTVMLGAARVRDNETGMEIASGALGDLAAKMIALREPVELTDEEAISVAFRLPSLASKVGGQCKLSAGGAFWPDEAQVALSCGNQGSDSDPVVAVNIRTGKTSDARTGKPIQSAEAIRVAQELLAAHERKRAILQSDIDAVCKR